MHSITQDQELTNHHHWKFPQQSHSHKVYEKPTTTRILCLLPINISKSPKIPRKFQEGLRWLENINPLNLRKLLVQGPTTPFDRKLSNRAEWGYLTKPISWTQMRNINQVQEPTTSQIPNGDHFPAGRHFRKVLAVWSSKTSIYQGKNYNVLLAQALTSKIILVWVDPKLAWSSKTVMINLSTQSQMYLGLEGSPLTLHNSYDLMVKTEASSQNDEYNP